MGKGIYWVVVVALGVFIGLFAFEQFKGYQERTVHQQAIEEQQAIPNQENAAQQAVKDWRPGEREQQQKKKPVQNTVCTMDANTDNCICIDKETGNRIPKTPYECVLRASKSSNAQKQ